MIMLFLSTGKLNGAREVPALARARKVTPAGYGIVST
jgi:hypothetical protein